MATIDIRGDIIPNDDKWIYDWLDWDATTPADVKAALDGLGSGETLTITINSGGGSVMAGQEIYSMLYGRDDVEIKIQSLAASAASVIAMAGKSEISPVAMIMVHNVSGGTAGNYHEMEKMAEILKQMDAALSTSYCVKTGKSKDEILKLMDEETWLTANQALEMGFVDAISQQSDIMMTNHSFGLRLTDEIRNRVLADKTAAENKENEKKQLLSDLDLYGV